jgi:ABC-type amino acid transport substrate-binding protein
LDSFAAKEGIQFEYVPVPVNRLYADFLDCASKLDFKFPDNENWAGDKKANKKIYYSDSVVEFTDGTMVAKDKIGRAKKDMKTLGTVRGFTPWDYLDDVQKAKTIRLVENDSLAGLLQQAKQGRVDGIYVNISVANYALNNTLKEPEALVFDKALPHTAST